MKHTLIFLSAFIIAHSSVVAQVSIFPQVIATSGGFASGANLSVSYTVGESVVTTATGSSNILTQGFQQPNDLINGLLDVEKETIGSLSVYPVPATTQLWFGYMFDQPGKVEVTLYDLLGQPLNYTLTENYDKDKVVHQLNCSTYAAGTYLLTVSITAIDNTRQNLSKQFQIIR